ncbi:probable fructose-2,6-bisphosphatase TIGAR A isoform X2 [Xyrauchen texanus]|uniref:probable fructose-2,6-bisphosphatase TIGAR A isoform X2 n=1 Tax=Xyrauchen texanus TaxID=154827 RepID=UPI0022420CE6|nr:probable fructose-2,6-bisphosphatase TIGAR A isoform X2 [Xyrauchen texanus]
MLAFGLTIVRHLCVCFFYIYIYWPVLLLRFTSGETQCNKDGILQGQKIDSPLSDIGIRQSEAAGQYLGDVKFTNVFVSDMKRAKQTAEIIVRNNRTCHDIELVMDPSLKERSFGIAEGGQVKEMKNMAKAAGQSLPEYTPPEGETMDQVKVRIKDFLKAMFQRIANDHQEKVQDGETPIPKIDGAGLPNDGVLNVPIHALVVGHGAYMSIAMQYFFEDLKCPSPHGSDPAQRFSICPNTGMCQFIIVFNCRDAGLTLSDIKCVFINRRDHIMSE